VGPNLGVAAHPPGHPSAGLPPAPHPDRIVFDKLIQILVFGCGYRRLADHSCSATTLHRRRDEWITVGVVEQLRLAVLAAYDHLLAQALTYIRLGKPTLVAVLAHVPGLAVDLERRGLLARGPSSSMSSPPARMTMMRSCLTIALRRAPPMAGGPRVV
jgi:hypothetical protein